MNLKFISGAVVLLGLVAGTVYAVLNNKTIPNIFNQFGKKNDVKVDDVKVDEVKNEVKDEVKVDEDNEDEIFNKK